MGTTRSVRSVEIGAPVERVFAFLAAPESMMSLMGSELGEVATAADGAVTRYEWNASFRLLPFDVHGVQTRLEHVPNRRIVESASTGPTTIWELEQAGESTCLTMTEVISSRLPLVNKVIEFIGTQGKGLAHKQDEILEEIKERVEA